MGGRIYDAHIGRFLQADPFVQAPSNSQSHNRYSYVLNNPLSYTDPSGYFFKKLKQFAAVIVGAALIYFTGGAGSWFVASWYGAATAGAIAGAVGAAVNGGSILKGAAWGAFSAAAFYGVGSAFVGDVAFGSGAHMLKTAAHGLVGGVMNTLQGGKFGHGFAAAGVAQFAAPGIDGIDSGNDFSTGRIALSAIAGGTASKLSGGKFANGAVTGAFSRMFNDEMHRQKRELAQRSLEDNQNAINRVLAARMRAATVDEMHRLAKMSIEELRNELMFQGFEGITNRDLRMSQMVGVKQLETLAHQLNAGDFTNADTAMILSSTPLEALKQTVGVLAPTAVAAFNPIGVSLWWQCSSACNIQSVYYADKYINRTIQP